MIILKTYSKSLLLLDELNTLISESGTVENFAGVTGTDIEISIHGDSLLNETALDAIVSGYTYVDSIYEIEEDIEDSIIGKSAVAVNYKSELKDGIGYTPVFTIHDQGAFAGLLDKTEYYRGFVDENNKGTLVLVVEENYTIDDSEVGLDHTAKPVLDRTKTWKHVKKSDGTLEETPGKGNKTKPKQYDTRRKRHSEGVRRRDNVIEQLIDNVGLAGVLSGAFTGVGDAHDKLTALQELHASSFTGWKSSGRGSLVGVIQTDTTTAWLDNTVADTGATQVMCPFMIGLTFRAYIQDKLKGNIK